ncbi:zinc finger protein 493-like [Thrips palmi]|uniref:Zinc finger protein 493-like n=1 Tax=Thrips palmi TaxID=161013 RepID=A0A6P9ADV8_THRPL|nr:zinc finger protein 493-like [Thrips palmi]
MADVLMKSSQCFVCDKDLSLSRDRNALLLSNLTEYSGTGLPTKIGQLMGDGFMVVVTACDEACSRCHDLLNLLDKLEVDLDKVRRLLTSYLRKKYGLLEIIKEEPSESAENRAPIFDERAKRNLEEDVNQIMYGKGGHLDIDFKSSILDENSKIIDLLKANTNTKQIPMMVPFKPMPTKVWKCKSCGMKCRSWKELRIHEKSHVLVSPKRFLFGCSMCDFTASAKSELDEHSRKHVFPKSFECEICSKCFNSQVSLDEHASTHKIYQCADCGAAYEQIESLTVHQCGPQDANDQSPVICVINVEPADVVESSENVADQLQSEENSQSTDFDSLCRDTLREEFEASDNTETDNIKEEEHNFAQKSDATSINVAFQNQLETLDEEMSSPISLFSGDDQFDMGAENEEGEDGIEEINEDAEDDFLNDGENFHSDKDSGKTVNKIFVNGVEVSFDDIVGQEGDSVLAVDLVSAELDEQTGELKDDTEGKVFVCSICEFRTEDQIEISKHLESHSIAFSLECEICQMKLKNQRTYEKHMQRHLSLKSPVPVACTVCKEITSDKFALRKHMLDNHPEVFKCQFCHESFESIRARRKHESEHDADSDKTCDECGKSFRKLSQLTLHKEYAHRELKCQHCEKQFDTIKKLKDHERRHVRDKEGFPCSQCDRVLKTSSGLKLHRAKHTGQYKFCCDVCGRGFMSKAILDEHMGRHTQEKRYTCDVCGKMFVFNSTMRIHRRWHDNPLPYKCKTCGQRFRHTSLLSVHRRRMHTGERPYKCPYCALTFTVSNCLKRHVVLHTGAYPYFCEPCNKGFTTKQKMAVHLAKVHNNKEMLNTKAPPCEYKMVIPNTPIQAPAELDDEKDFVTGMEGVEHVGEVQHVIIQGDQQQLEAEGNIQLQIITMDPDHGFSVFE